MTPNVYYKRFMVGKCGIIFVHGIVGNNRIFEFLRPFVPDGYRVKYVCLKGHGGDALAFSKASMAQWKAQIEEAVAEMSAQCDVVIGVGHSMGCLLLMEQAVRNQLSGLFLLNPPMKIRLSASLFRNAIKVATGQIKDDPVANAAKNAYGISIDFNPLHYYGWPKRYAELFLAIRRVRENVIPQIRIPVMTFLSERDEMVSLSSEKYIESIPSASTMLLPTSTHYYYSDDDRQIICHEFASFLNSFYRNI